MANINEIATEMAKMDLEFTADCVETYPFENSFGEPNLVSRFVMGMYQLLTEPGDTADSNTQRRCGKLNVVDVIADTDGKYSIKEIEEIYCCGVFDIKWSHNPVCNKHLLGQSGSDGKITIYQANNDENSKNWLTELLSSDDGFEHDNNGKSEMCLSLDWSNRVFQSDEPLISSSFDNGHIKVHKLTDSQGSNNGLSLINDFKAHDFEAWITAFDYHNYGNTIYTGGDDGLFKGWDIRQDAAVPIFTSKFHQAGVCSIQSNPHNQHLLATGSYDSTVNVWDKRSMKSPIISEYIDGSGIWRVKWHPKSQEKLLVAAMNSGICTLDLSIDSKKVNSINQFTKHQSLGYGADWNYFGNMDKDIVLSCSFYDKVSYLWESPRL